MNRTFAARCPLTPTALSALVALAACSSSSSAGPPSGTVACGPELGCPSGYGCAPDMTCWKKGEKPGSGGAGGAGGTGASGTGGAGTFVGIWRFGDGSTAVSTCSDGTNVTTPLAAQTLKILAGPPADLVVQYDCNFQLTLDASATTTSIVAGQTCDATMAPSTVVYTWVCDKFEIVSRDGGFTATVDASLSNRYLAPDGRNTTCSVALTGTLTWVSAN